MPDIDLERDAHPRKDARRLDDFVADELASLTDPDPARPAVRRRGDDMPASEPTPEYRAWLARRAAQ